ncbi:ComEA family DNA-binding protein [Vibrio parahaemolyticus]|nr:ComEA family DNA-binding protein [Vibrio parahaemolyticus]
MFAYIRADYFRALIWSVYVQYEGIEITVNINTASAEEIATMLKGIGEKKAQSIVDYRTEHGPFKTAADLTNVKGIGEATIKKNEDRILL